MSSGSGRRSRSRLGAVDYDEVTKEDPDNYDVHEAQRYKNTGRETNSVEWCIRAQQGWPGIFLGEVRPREYNEIILYSCSLSEGPLGIILTIYVR